MSAEPMTQEQLEAIQERAESVAPLQHLSPGYWQRLALHLSEDVDDLLAEVERLRTRLTEIRRVYTLAELGQRCGCTRSAAQGWARRPDFPAPDVQLGAAHGWAWETFKSWAAEHRPDLLGGLT